MQLALVEGKQNHSFFAAKRFTFAAVFKTQIC